MMASFPFWSLLFDTRGLLCDRCLGSRGREPSNGGCFARSGLLGGLGGASHVRDKRSEPQGLDAWLGVNNDEEDFRSNLFDTGKAR